MEQRDQHGLELAHTNSNKVGHGCPTFNANDTWTSIDELKQYLATQRGVKKVPLDYAVRPDIELTALVTDDCGQYNDLNWELAA